MDFEQRLHAVAQRLIPQRGNSGYPPLVVYYHRGPPVLGDDKGHHRLPPRLDPRFLDAARRLGAWADFLVVTANAPHLHLPDIEQAAGRPVLSMVALAVDEVRRRDWTRIGLLGLGDPVVYRQPLDQLGLAHETLSETERTPLDAAIFALMEGRVDVAARAAARTAVATLRARPVDGVILGCTEIPLLLGAEAEAPDLLSPLTLLAEAAVRAALAE